MCSLSLEVETGSYHHQKPHLVVELVNHAVMGPLVILLKMVTDPYRNVEYMYMWLFQAASEVLVSSLDPPSTL